MKSKLIPSIAIVTTLTVVNSFAASPPTPKLTKADKPLVDLGMEVGGVTNAPMPSKSEPFNMNKPRSEKYPAPKRVPSSTHSSSDGMQMMNEPAVEVPKIRSKPKKAQAKWSYSGDTGPRYWADLSAENMQCATGKNQSPVDLRDKHGVGTTGLPELDIRYRDVALKVINTGKSLQVNYPLGSYIKVGGQRYELMNFNFHTPSEHKKEGFNYPMEVQLVHKDGDGNHAVIAIIFQEGEENEQLQVLLDNLPKQINKQEIHRGETLNPVMFFPGNTDFYKYSGSLTTPPCTEGVYWMIFKHPIEASAEQIQEMSEVMGDNSRPVQRIGARTLLKSWAEQLQEPPMYEFY